MTFKEALNKFNNQPRTVNDAKISTLLIFTVTIVFGVSWIYLPNYQPAITPKLPLLFFLAMLVISCKEFQVYRQLKKGEISK